MRTHIFYILSLIISYNLSAQHDILSLSNVPNNIYLNPASTGYENTFISTLTFRADEIGNKNHPKNLSLSAHSPLKNEKWNIGVHILNNRFGPSQVFNLSGLLSHKIKMNSGTLSLGVRIGIQNHKIEESSLITTISNDPELTNNTNIYSPGLGFGLLFKNDIFYIGVSIPNTSNNSSLNENNGWNQMLSTGINYYIQGKTNLSIHVSSRRYGNGFIQFQAIPQIEYNDNLKAGIIIRGKNHLGMLFSYWITNKLNLAYVYEKNIGQVLIGNTSNHEIGLSYRLKEIVNTFNPKFF